MGSVVTPVHVEGDLEVGQTVVVVSEEGDLELADVEETARVTLGAEAGGYLVSVSDHVDTVVLNVHPIGRQVGGVFEVDTADQRLVGDCG